MKELSEPVDIERFREAVERRLGLAFGDDKRGMLLEILRDRAARRGEPAGLYLERLEGARRAGEWKYLAALLTVSETYFFRHYEQFRAFAEVVVGARIRELGAGCSLSILSAGCASGEEAYSLAMMVREIGSDAVCKVSVLGVDVNAASIEKALEGRYSPWALRETSPERRERWFRPQGRDYILDDSILRMVRFEERNLADDDQAFWHPQSHDVIFCRNMLMYFSQPRAQALVRRLARCLVPGGHLFLGYAENLRGLSQEFHLCHTHEAFYYQKRCEGEIAGRPDIVEAASGTSAMEVQGFAVPDVAWVDAIGRAAERIRTLSEDARPDLNGGSTTDAGTRAGLGHAHDLLRLERYGEALSALGPASGAVDDDAEALLLRAVLFVHSGRLAEAQQACQRLVELDELNSGAQYTLALCREGTGDTEAAVRHHQSAVYLDPSFAMPHLQLGLIARRRGDHKGARDELQSALLLLQREESARLLLFGGGFSREALLDLCRSELQACGVPR